MSHYKSYPAYKDSGVEWLGRVPEHWDLVPLKYVTPSLTVGIVVNPSDYVADEGLPFLYGGDIGEGEIFAESARRISPEDSQRNAKTKLMAGDLVTVRVGAPGITAVVPPMCEGGNCASVMLVRRGDFESDWLCYVMNSRVVRYQVEVVQYGAAQEQFNISHAVDFLIPVPPRAEQASIAVRFLNRETARIDALMEKKTRFIELLREKRQALITHAVTKGLDPNVKMKDSGVEWLGEVPEHWLLKRFRDLCISISTGPFGTALGNEDYVTGGVPIINPSHIVDEQCCPDPDITVSVETAERLSFWAMRSGDLVTARRGELGRAAVITDEQDGWICGTGSLRVRPDSSRVLIRYLHTLLQSRYAREWLNLASVGATMANLNEGILGELPLAVPPSTVEQEKLLASLEMQIVRLSKIEQKASASVALLKERRSALITAAVTGQIDLREFA